MKFSIETKLESSIVITALQDRLTKRYVRIKTDNNSITSTYTPFPLLSFDRKMYSKDNWIGINPFQFISNIKIVCSKEENDNTIVNINVSTASRAWFWILFWFSLATLIISANLIAGLIAMAIATIINLIILCCFANYLLKIEINDAIKKVSNNNNLPKIVS